MELKDARLCYVRGECAWFTTCEPFEKQWGDDWNDRPYEHNAGDPYAWEEHRGVDRYELVRVYFDGDLVAPDEGYMNSPYSVEDINGGAVAWLREYAPSHRRAKCWKAGVSLETFVRELKEEGIGLYMEEETWRALS